MATTERAMTRRRRDRRVAGCQLRAPRARQLRRPARPPTAPGPPARHGRLLSRAPPAFAGNPPRVGDRAAPAFRSARTSEMLAGTRRDRAARPKEAARRARRQGPARRCVVAARLAPTPLV